MGTPVHPGLSSEAAAELGLKPGTAVGVSIIDAHAGGLGVIASDCDCCPEVRRVSSILLRRQASTQLTIVLHSSAEPLPASWHAVTNKTAHSLSRVSGGPMKVVSGDGTVSLLITIPYNVRCLLGLSYDILYDGTTVVCDEKESFP